MKRILLYVVVPLLVAVASLANVVAFDLENLLRPNWTPTLRLAWNGSIALIILFAVLAGFAAFLSRALLRRVAFAASLVLVLVAGFIPRGVDMREQMAAAVDRQAAAADAELNFQSDFLDRTDDVQQRIDAKTPYSAADALAFLEFAASADLSWRGLPDHTSEAYALLEQAISAGVVDPNALVPGPVADVPPVTLTVAFYDKWIREGSPRTILKQDWDVLQILVAKGADLSSPAAAEVRADLARTVVLGGGRFLGLQ